MVDVPLPSIRPTALQYQGRGFIGSREQLPSGEKGRRIALDFNSASDPTPGVEIIVPDDIADEELKASKAYVEGVAKLFDKYGYGGYGIRSSSFHPGVKRRGVENKDPKTGEPRGISNTFHTEPFFRQDKKAVEIFMLPEFQKEYMQLLNGTLRTIPDSVIMAPHKKKGQGTEFRYDGEKVTERSLGLSLMNQMFPDQEPTSEAEIDRQQDDPIGAVILASADVSPNNNTSSNDSIGAALTSMAQTTNQSLSDVLSPQIEQTMTMTLDIDTSPATMAQRISQQKENPAFSDAVFSHAMETGQLSKFGTMHYDPELKRVARY